MTKCWGKTTACKPLPIYLLRLFPDLRFQILPFPAKMDLLRSLTPCFSELGIHALPGVLPGIWKALFNNYAFILKWHLVFIANDTGFVFMKMIRNVFLDFFFKIF